MALQIIFQILYVITIIIEALLSVRFILKLIGANASIGLVSWIYGITDGILAPVRGVILDHITIWGVTIELTTILMIFLLTLIAYAFFEIIKAVQK